MKRTLLSLGFLALSAITLFGQGRVWFSNAVSGNAIALWNWPINQNQGAGGAYVGSTYSIQLLWAPQGTYGSLNGFYAAVLGSSTPVQFFGATGGSPGTDGAGLFDGGLVPNPLGTAMPAGTYTMLARAWYNGGGQYATFDAAFSAMANTGVSAFFDITATEAPTSATSTIFPSFRVGIIPEPSTLGLIALGIAGLLLACRARK